MDSHHCDIHVSLNTYGGEYKSISDDTLFSSVDLDLQGIDSKFVSHSLQPPFVNEDALLIQNDPQFSLIHTSLDDESEKVICQVFESFKDGSQSDCHVYMLVFDYYINDNDVDSSFFQLQSDLSTMVSPPLESYNPLSPLAHYSLYPNVFDTFVTPTTPLNSFNLVDHGCNQVQYGAIFQSIHYSRSIQLQIFHKLGGRCSNSEWSREWCISIFYPSTIWCV